MTALMLPRTDSCRNMARFYKLDIQPTLFGEWSFVPEWGRIRRAGTVRVEAYCTREKRTLPWRRIGRASSNGGTVRAIPPGNFPEYS